MHLPLLLDGGLATQLEAAGHDLNHALWSAHLLEGQPEAIVAVHAAYLAAGADILTTAGYQNTLSGWLAIGRTHRQAQALVRLPVDLAVQALAAYRLHTRDMRMVHIAASMGPYGAFLADGSEFSGAYGLDAAALYAHHRLQWDVLVASAADWLVFETVPSRMEAEVLAQLFRETPGRMGWISFSCRDGGHTCAGDPIGDVVPLVEATEGLIGLGINCTAPAHISPLLQAARAAGLRKPAIVYPNSGETFDPFTRGWLGKNELARFVAQAQQWRTLGAGIIGGCCRTGPEHVRALKHMLQVTGEKDAHVD
jgi:homocysteine S-methyltransferase